jgi:chromosomal replication initiator protein
MSKTGERVHETIDTITENEETEFRHPWVTPGINQSGYEFIADMVCEFYGIDREVIFTKNRKRELVWARQVIHYLCHTHIKKQTLGEVGFRCGEKDHATVLHSKKTVLNMTDSYQETYDEVHNLEKKVMAAKGTFNENRKRDA